MPLWVWVCACVCVRWVWVCACVWVCVSVRVCESVRVCVSEVSVRVSVNVSVRVCESACVWVNVCMHACSVTKSHLTFTGPRTIAHQAPLSMDFSRQRHWSGLPFPAPRIKPTSLAPPALAGRLFMAAPPRRPWQPYIPAKKSSRVWPYFPLPGSSAPATLDPIISPAQHSNHIRNYCRWNWVHTFVVLQSTPVRICCLSHTVKSMRPSDKEMNIYVRDHWSVL